VLVTQPPLYVPWLGVQLVVSVTRPPGVPMDEEAHERNWLGMTLLIVACLPCPIIVWYAAGAAGRWSGEATVWTLIGSAAVLCALGAPVLAILTNRPWMWKTTMLCAFVLLATFWIGLVAS
jgi:hypothetical protein